MATLLFLSSLFLPHHFLSLNTRLELNKKYTTCLVLEGCSVITSDHQEQRERLSQGETQTITDSEDISQPQHDIIFIQKYLEVSEES